MEWKYKILDIFKIDERKDQLQYAVTTYQSSKNMTE